MQFKIAQKEYETALQFGDISTLLFSLILPFSVHV